MASVSRNAIASVSQVVASTFIMFVLYRTILGILGVEKLGVWSIVLATASASRIGELGLSASVTRFVAKYKAQGDSEVVGVVVQTAVISIVVMLCFTLFPAYFLLGLLLEHIFERGVLDEAIAILPYALFSLFLTTVSGVFLSGLDGCQRYDWRVLLTIINQLLFLFLALSLAPRYGLIGLAWAQVGQSAISLVTGWLLLRHILPGLPWMPYKWQRSSFKEMLGYGLQFQLGAVAMMLFDPLTKVLLGKYGGLSSAGYYEMANQFVAKARALIVAANQVLIPVVAGLGIKTNYRLKELYRTNLRLLFYGVVPIFALTTAWAPILSEVWIGQLEPIFVYLVMVLSLAWCLNTFAVPAYFYNQGRGRLIWNTISHIWMGLINASLGIFLGSRFGIVGVVWGMTFALVTGSVIIVAGFHRENDIPWTVFIPKDSMWLIVVSLTIAGFAGYVNQMMQELSTISRILISILLPLFTLTPVLWLHPVRAVFQQALLARNSAKI